RRQCADPLGPGLASPPGRRDRLGRYAGTEPQGPTAVSAVRVPRRAGPSVVSPLVRVNYAWRVAGPAPGATLQSTAASAFALRDLVLRRQGGKGRRKDRS